MFDKPKNINYAVSVIKLKNKIPLKGLDRLCHTNINGNLVVIPNYFEIGQLYLYFEPESQLSEKFLHENNLFRHQNLNKNPELKGYFEDSRRLKCVKFRKFESRGLLLSLESVSFTKFDIKKFKEGDLFDSLNNIEICRKYKKTIKEEQKLKKKEKKKEKYLIEGQFNFHVDTPNLHKTINELNLDDVIHISKKLHGTSLVSSKILCKKQLKWYEKLFQKLGVNIVDTEYRNVFSSRTVIRKPNMGSFYGEDIWETGNESLKDSLRNGMTIYAEIVGYLKNGKYIQKSYDYGCKPTFHDVYAYRITYTNSDGVVFEFSPTAVKEYCERYGLKHVPLLFTGTIREYLQGEEYGEDNFREVLANKLKEQYLEKKCSICVNNVPDEGIVIRKDGLDLNVYKFKSTLFLEGETKLIDEDNEENIEENENVNNVLTEE